MRFSLPAASLIALALFAGPLMAEVQPLMQVAQAQVPPRVQLYLDNHQTPASQLTVPMLDRRIRVGRAMMQFKGVSPETKQQIREIVQAAMKERQSRQQAEAQTPDTAETQGTAQTQGNSGDTTKMAQTAPEAPAGDTQQAAPAQIPPAVAAYLADARAAEELDESQLRNRVATGQQFAQRKALPAETRQKIRQKLRADRVALQAKAGGAQTAQQPAEPAGEVTTPDTAAPKVAQAETSAGTPAEVTAFLADTSDPASLPVPDLRARIRQGQTLAQLPNLSPALRQQIRQKNRAYRAAVQTKPPVQDQAVAEPSTSDAAAPGFDPTFKPKPADEKDVILLDRNEGDADAERRAMAILDNARKPNEMSAAELRTSLYNIRALLGENKLSRKTEGQLRERLALERRILRSRVTAERREDRRDRRRGRRDDQVDPRYLVDINIVIGDRRPSEELAELELRRRIEVLLQAMEDERYEAAERARWRAQVERDRLFLRQRMVEFRREREGYLREAPEIELGLELNAGQPYVVEAAEADEEEIEDVLVAAPRRRLDRRYSIEEIENSAELRDALPRVEIDTIRFGFNESFVREEEVENLEKVGEIIERVLAKNPNEVFLIEGHTDAVGSESYNLTLSRQRAVAVKEALSEYFVIPAENLRTAGYGERLLKIPTAEEEQENRRVSVSRATSLLGSLEQ